MDHSRIGPQLAIFQPRLVLLCSLTGAALVGLYLLRYEHVRANVLDPGGTFQYFVPLMVPCFAFMIERVQHVRKANFFQHGVDFLVFGLAVGRVVGREVLHVSGHTLLLSYMLVSSRSKIVLIASILVLGQTLFLKYYVWGDFVTSQRGDDVRLLSGFDRQVGFEKIHHRGRDWKVILAAYTADESLDKLRERYTRRA